MNKTQGFTFYIAIGSYGGFNIAYWKGFNGIRICLGFIAIMICLTDIENLMANMHRQIQTLNK